MEIVFPTSLFLLIIVLGYIILPTLLVFFTKKLKVLKILSMFLFVVFLICLAFGVIGQIDIDSNQIIYKLVFNGQWFSKNFDFSFWNASSQDIIINIAMLFPVGIFVSVWLSKKTKLPLWGLCIGAGIGLLIEISQLILPVLRSPSLSDIFLNSFSVVIGVMYFNWAINIHKKRKGEYQE